MSRSQKKCLVVSAGLHLGLLSLVVLLSAFRPAAPAGLEFQPIDFIPVVTTFDNMSGGGDPHGQTPPPPPPAPAVQKPAPSAPRQPAPEPPPKLEEESFTPSPRPTRRRPQIDLSQILTRPLHEKKTRVKPKENEEDTQAQDRELARAAAEARRRLMGELGQVASAIGNSRSGPISVNLKGPGGGGLTYANFWQAVSSLYRREWIIPDGATESDATTEAEITIARDGAVVSAVITRSSGNAAIDQSVRLTLDRVRRVPRLPPDSEQDRVTITINFNALSQGQRRL